MDRRTKYTIQTIKSAFLDRMSQQEYANISVAEICRAAEINRSTFYLHYHKIDDVLNAVLEDAIEEFDNVFTQFGAHSDVCNRAFCNFVRNNDKYRAVFLDDTISDYIIAKIAKHMMQAQIDFVCERTTLSRNEAEQIFWFQLHGCFSVIKHNLSKEEGEWSEIKCTIDQFIRRGLFGNSPT